MSSSPSNPPSSTPSSSSSAPGQLKIKELAQGDFAAFLESPRNPVVSDPVNASARPPPPMPIPRVPTQRSETSSETVVPSLPTPVPSLRPAVGVAHISEKKMTPYSVPTYFPLPKSPYPYPSMISDTLAGPGLPSPVMRGTTRDGNVLERQHERERVAPTYVVPETTFTPGVPQTPDEWLKEFVPVLPPMNGTTSAATPTDVVASGAVPPGGGGGSGGGTPSRLPSIASLTQSNPIQVPVVPVPVGVRVPVHHLPVVRAPVHPSAVGISILPTVGQGQVPQTTGPPAAAAPAAVAHLHHLPYAAPQLQPQRPLTTVTTTRHPHPQYYRAAPTPAPGVYPYPVTRNVGVFGASASVSASTSVSADTNPSSLLEVVRGFTRPPLTGETHPGGRDNSKMPLPMHSIRLHSVLLPASMDPRSLSIRSLVLGFDKGSGDKTVLGEMSEKRFELKNVVDLGLSQVWVADFDFLICRFSSHANGGRLALRFVLMDHLKHQMAFVDTQHFLTITKRGLMKQRRRIAKKQEEGGQLSPTALKRVQLVEVRPAIGLVNGGQIVKIFGFGFDGVSPIKLRVRFGNVMSKEVSAVLKNTIIVQTPAQSECGPVSIMVSLDGVSYGASNVSFTYVDSRDATGLKQMVDEMVRCSQL